MTKDVENPIIIPLDKSNESDTSQIIERLDESIQRNESIVNNNNSNVSNVVNAKTTNVYTRPLTADNNNRSHILREQLMFAPC